MKKRILCIILTVCMVMSLLPTWVVAQELTHLSQVGKQDTALQSIAVQNIGPNEAEVENDLYEKISAQVSFIKLISDIEISGSLWIGYEVTLDLNGHVLKMADDVDGSVIVVSGRGHLTLIDGDSTAEHKFKVNGTDPWVLDETGGTETVKGGVITGGTGSRIDSASESNTISDDSICGGGALIEKGGKLTMIGGNIVGCTAAGNNAFGGGVFVRIGGTFEMSGGSIAGCTAAAQGGYGFAWGGGIRNNGFDSDVGRTTLSGTAVIRDCHATGGNWLFGGGISDGGTLNISGDVTIIGCTADGESDAMYVWGNNGSSVTGGTFYGSITDNGGKITDITVKYHLNNNENYATQVLQSGDKTGIPDPAKSGHTFDGWYKADGTKWDAAAPVTENLTLTGWLYAGVKTADEFTAALADTNIETIRLTQDITLPSGNTGIKITEGRRVILDLNGYVLDLAGKYIAVTATSIGDGGKKPTDLNKLTIIDSRAQEEHKFKDDGTGLWVRDETGGDKIVKGGVITGGNDSMGGAIGVGQYGIVIMNGGNIVGCSAESSGGAVFVTSSATFTMNGGSIVGCKALWFGGGVHVMNDSKFIMNGGSIIDCVVESNFGGGSAVYVRNNSTFTMAGGFIADCTAANGSALYLSDGTMSAGGGTVDGAVLLDGDSTIIGGGSTFSGLIINNNTQARFSGAHSSLGIVGEKPMGVNGHNYCTVTFDSEDGTMENTTRYFLRGKNISGEIKPELRTGYTFGGWNKADGTAWDYAKDTVTEGITLYAK